MAEARVSVNLDEFSCPICLDLLKDPVSLPCGHSFCMSCINTQWDGEARSRVYSCPMCKQRFSPRPALGRNIVLAEMVEKLKKTRVPERTLAGPEDVECDVCVGKKHKAVYSCLVCLASYCQVHFNLHRELNPGNTHRVTKARYKLQDRICRQHNRLQDVLCFTEERLVCSECVRCSCTGHNTTTFTSHRYRQQQEIGKIRTQVLQRTQAAENSVKDLKKAIQSIKSSAKKTLDQSEKIFAELMSSAERKRSEIRGIIKAAEGAEVQQAQEILKRMEQEVTKLKKIDDELVQLPHLDDDFLFLRTSRSLSDFSAFDDVTHITVDLSPFKEIQNSVSELAIKVKEFCTTGLHTTSSSVNRCHMVQTSVPMLREDFLQYFRQMTVDPRTNHKDLQLSEAKRKITFGGTNPNNDRGPERFNYYAQALCREALQERCYWEVEWGGQQVYIAASYRGVERTGCCSDVGFGHNDKSWSLCCKSSRFVFFHNAQKTVISGPVSTRIGIYLDHTAGSLSFYSITGTTKLLHRVRTTFTEPLYAGFWVFNGSSVKLCEKNEKVPPHTRPAAANTTLGELQFSLNYNCNQYVKSSVF
ncbi:hypothetical protein PDJAM_G00258860 [Pangasius djambal]|nr:hypothetical protein [Pangasius djambal]